MKNHRHSLNGTWDLCFTEPDHGTLVRTTICVPSNIEPKLAELGLVADYMPADYEFTTEKFEAVDDWTYTKVFDAPAVRDGFRQKLVLEGIDTIAEVCLNGETVCQCRSMHLTYRIDVTGKLKPTGNVLTITIRSAVHWAAEQSRDTYAVPHGVSSYYDAQLYLRKARHQWGWDNAPRLITSGIYRPVYLEEVPLQGFEEVSFATTKITEQTVTLGVHWRYRSSQAFWGDHTLRLTVRDGERLIFAQDKAVHFIQGTYPVQIPREDISLWWPAGFGEPKLYDVTLEMLAAGQSVSAYTCSFGFRTLQLERTEDILEDGTGEFVFRVNGEKVYIRGTCWKPLDPLASLADQKTKTGEALQEIRNLNCNMVRIWGGGIYEDSVFYDFCDRSGIMVWQDFMFACEIPLTDEWYCRLAAEEARQVIQKYRNHPSLAVWCGDNENDECLMWKHLHSTLLPSDMVISRKVLKDAVRHYDPYRCYVESSPYASDKNFAQRRTGKMTHFQPETHLYPNSVLFREILRDLKSRFLGETGPIQVNAITANEKIFAREKARAERLWDSPKIPGNDSHQSDAYFTKWRLAGKALCEHDYGRDFPFSQWKEYMLAINLSCAELFKDVIEYCRVTRWSKTGVIWWSLADMWPMLFNYSVLDCELNRKLPYFWIRQSQQDFALMAVRTEITGDLALYAVNDTLTPHTAAYTVTAFDAQGNSSLLAEGTCTQEKNSVSQILSFSEPQQSQLWILKWTENGKTFMNHVCTGNASFEICRRWVQIIGEEGRFLSEIPELK